MHIRTCLRAGVAAAGVAVLGVTATTAAPVASAAQSQTRQSAAQNVQLTAATVPLGGLVISFVNNQVIYCSIICPLLVETAVAPVVPVLQAPVTFLSALSSGDLLKAIGQTAASVTGPTNAAAQAAIVADGSIPAKRALNALEVGVVGLLRVIPAAEGGLPGIVSAIETARQDTFTALNLPVVPNPAPTVMPHGVVEVAVVGALNVGGAIIFPAFNHVLSAVFEVPDAVAQELAATGDPVRAAVAGLNTAVSEASAAVTVIADAVGTAIKDIDAASKQPSPADQTVSVQNSVKTTTPTQTERESADTVVTAKKRATATAGPSHPLRALMSGLQQSVPSDIGRGDSRHSDTSRAMTSRAAPSRAAPSRAIPSRATPSRATASRATASRATTSRATASRATTSRATTSGVTARKPLTGRTTPPTTDNADQVR